MEAKPIALKCAVDIIEKSSWVYTLLQYSLASAIILMSAFYFWHICPVNIYSMTMTVTCAALLNIVWLTVFFVGIFPRWKKFVSRFVILFVFSRWKRFVSRCCWETIWSPLSAWTKSEVWTEICLSPVPQLGLNRTASLKRTINTLCCRRRSGCAVPAKWKSRWTVRRWRTAMLSHLTPGPTQQIWLCAASGWCNASDCHQAALSLRR